MLVAQSCPTLWDPVGFSPPGSSVHGILQARIPEWVAISFSRGSSWPWDQTLVSCLGDTGEVLYTPLFLTLPQHFQSFWSNPYLQQFLSAPGGAFPSEGTILRSFLRFPSPRLPEVPHLALVMLYWSQLYLAALTCEWGEQVFSVSWFHCKEILRLFKKFCVVSKRNWSKIQN